MVAVSGSSPAYVYMFIEAMADGAVRLGMPRKMAIQAAAQAVLGSAKMVLTTGEHPAALKDNVCSPGGTTIEAVQSLEKNGFRSAVLEAMDACARKNRKCPPRQIGEGSYDPGHAQAYRTAVYGWRLLWKSGTWGMGLCALL